MLNALVLSMLLHILYVSHYITQRKPIFNSWEFESRIKSKQSESNLSGTKILIHLKVQYKS